MRFFPRYELFVLVKISIMLSMATLKTLAVFTLEDDLIVWHLSVCSSRQVTRHEKKIVFPDCQISDDLFVVKFVRPVCTSDLFV